MQASSPTLINCTFSGNHAVRAGDLRKLKRQGPAAFVKGKRYRYAAR